MPKPYTGVYKRANSALWQLRIRVPADLTSLYTTAWALRVSLGTSDLREANERAVALWDEWRSTSVVERELIGMDVSRARRAEVIDEHAAIFILQGALDRLSNLRGDR